jgi:hypothetical protein
MKLQIAEIAGEYGVGLLKILRDNFKKISDEFTTNSMVRGKFRFFELRFSSDSSHLKVKHFLGYQPLDVIQLSKTGTGTIVYNYALFDNETIDLDISGTSASNPLVVRFFLGRYS